MFNARTCTDLTLSAQREWLETNGIGSFASATISGMNTRRYHALLVASLKPPTHRYVLLSRIEEAITIGKRSTEFSTNTYRPTVTHPRGFEYQTEFRLTPFPTFTFHIFGVTVQKQIFMPYGANATVIRYSLIDAPDANDEARRANDETKNDKAKDASITLSLRPLFAFRDYHSLTRADEAHRPHADFVNDKLIKVSSGDASLHCFLAHNASQINLTETFYRNFELAEERARGFDYTEDLFNPFELTRKISANDSFDIIASTDIYDIAEVNALQRREDARRAAELARCPSKDKTIRTLWTASTQFIVERQAEAHNSLNDAAQQQHRAPDKLQTIIAGYHWFTDWGRDTMIALPGLTLATRRFDSAREILLAFASYIEQGLIPNNFPDTGETPSYNTIDATLWFVHACGEYTNRTHDTATRDKLYPHLKDIIAHHERGTFHDIRVGTDGLLRGGDSHTQLTWMDAKIGDFVVTPRNGRAVEIQALWFNALHIIADLARKLNDDSFATNCTRLAAHAQKSFNRLFWNKQQNCLYDLLRDDNTPDASVRPNQIFALSLPYRILTDDARARAVLATVERELLTPYGLRSLAPGDAQYRPIYEGDSFARDTAYHQGTVWTWLIGHFITAYLNLNGRRPATLARVSAWLQPLREHLLDRGVGQLHEIFDAAAPHTPRGAIAQAWSVAEVLRCELDELEPKP